MPRLTTLRKGDRVAHVEDMAGTYGGIVTSIRGGMINVRWDAGDPQFGTYGRYDLIHPKDEADDDAD